MSYIPLAITVGIIALLYFYIRYFHIHFIGLLRWLGTMPRDSSDYIFPTLLRVIRLNWYTILMMIILYFLLFKPDVGKDIIADYLSNLMVNEKDFGFKVLSLGSLAGVFFLLSMSIWSLHYFMYSKARIRTILNRPLSFYLATKIKSLMAMIPYGIIGAAFIAASASYLHWKLPNLLINVIFIIAFFLVQTLITAIGKSRIGRLKIYKITFWDNRYLNILLRVFLWHVILIVVTALLLKYCHNSKNFCMIVTASFLLLSSAIVFRLMFYSDDTHSTTEEVKKIVREMLRLKNRKHSRIIYLLIGFLLLLIVGYYFKVPSLTGTNSLYILGVVFGFIIIYLDFLRNLFTNARSLLIEIVAAIAVLAFLVMPFVSPKNQYSVPIVKYEGLGKISLDRALKMRIDSINSLTNNTGNIYIICGMGGGSRAGYITTSVLSILESMDSKFWDRTLCYSTISGSSPGVYHYIKAKQARINDKKFMRSIYQRNYNSSGVFGLLFADGCEALFGGLLSTPISWFRDSTPMYGYYDRNVRLRAEYEYALQQALSGNFAPADNGYKEYTWKTNPKIHWGRYKPDAFEKFFQDSPGKYPIHFVNTFEINSGRRTVLSPFPVADTNVFNNSILPLQDTSYSATILNEDLMYRDATNLSELFPFVSAAAQIGNKSPAQFVDGGYFENYGLATALDVYEYIRQRLDSSLAKRIKIILIKNSKQEPSIDKKSLQIIAPLSGALSSPFTGHANHFQQLFQNRFNADSVKYFFTVEFDADAYNVPLTRALTRQHIESMDMFARHIRRDSVNLKQFLAN